MLGLLLSIIFPARFRGLIGGQRVNSPSGHFRAFAPKDIMSRRLFGKQILVLQSEALNSLDLVFALEEIGASVVVAPTAPRARELLELRRIAAAVVDPGISEDVRALCEHFRGAGIPFVIHGGSDGDDLGAAHSLARRAPGTAIAAAVAAVFQRDDCRTTSPLGKRPVLSQIRPALRPLHSGETI
jgi:hypothetical protein